MDVAAKVTSKAPGVDGANPRLPRLGWVDHGALCQAERGLGRGVQAVASGVGVNAAVRGRMMPSPVPPFRATRF